MPAARLTARTASTAGAGVEIGDGNGQADQSWEATPTGELRVSGDSMCLEACNNQTTPGAKVDIWNCNGQSNQRWQVNSDGCITGVQSSLCTNQRWATSGGSVRRPAAARAPCGLEPRSGRRTCSATSTASTASAFPPAGRSPRGWPGRTTRNPRNGFCDVVKNIVGSSVPIALHENGPIRDPDHSPSTDTRWSFFNTWNTDHLPRPTQWPNRRRSTTVPT
ncbi:ricin-type beta-trefoil lectin domain protein [Streptomyces sp. TLI_55]|uniref:ricin-type beta-trefoil lectin domain protein n=1 Tax=Streptomyces sp. TLI_55 TaxID=1938861 RepID=UPI00359CAA9A